jgi:hypothetical protein
MPLLGALLVNLFGAIASFFGLWLTKKAAIVTAALAVFAALTVGLMAALAAAITAALELEALPDAVIFGMSYFMPGNFPGLFSAVIAAEVAIALYRWNVKNLELATYAG